MRGSWPPRHVVRDASQPSREASQTQSEALLSAHGGCTQTALWRFALARKQMTRVEAVEATASSIAICRAITKGLAQLGCDLEVVAMYIHATPQPLSTIPLYHDPSQPRATTLCNQKTTNGTPASGCGRVGEGVS